MMNQQKIYLSKQRLQFRVRAPGGPQHPGQGEAEPGAGGQVSSAQKLGIIAAGKTLRLL